MENHIQLQLHHFCIINYNYNYNYVIGPGSVMNPLEQQLLTGPSPELIFTVIEYFL